MRRREGRPAAGKEGRASRRPRATCKRQKKRTKIVKSNAEKFSLTASDATRATRGEGDNAKRGRGKREACEISMLPNKFDFFM